MAQAQAFATEEKRKHARLTVQEEISYTVNGASYSTHTIDIGAGGVKFATAQFLPPMTPATITLERAGVSFHGLVIWSLRIGSHFTAAVKFAELSSDQQRCLAQLF